MRRFDSNNVCIEDCVTSPRLRQRLPSSSRDQGGWECGGCGQVFPSDVTLVPPPSSGPIVGAVTAYNWRSDQAWPAEQYELPMYSVLDRDRPDFWTYLVDELLLSRLNVVVLHGRGCHDKSPDAASDRGTGNMCPRLLRGFVDAVERAGVGGDVLRAAMWDDTGMYRTARNVILGDNATTFDVGDESNWQYFWDYNIKIWFDTVPEKLWYRIDGKPVIASWNLRNNKFSNQEGNASRLLTWLREKFQNAYGVQPYIVLEETWFTLDSTVGIEHADGKHGWFSPPDEPYTYVDYNGRQYGVVVPGFRESGTEPGCGTDCRELLRRDGKTLRDGLEQGTSSCSANLILLEGWTSMIESAGFYRSQNWSYPTQYINIARRYADPEPETLLFQAEGADDFFDTTPENNFGGEYSNRSLDVGALRDGTGWYVGWTEAGEWIEYKDVHLGCGIYRFSARAATTVTSEVRIKLALGSLESVVVPQTSSGDDYGLVHLGEIQLTAATNYDLRVEFETAGVNLDWFFSKRVVSTDCVPSTEVDGT
jgi:hypothetical protein